MPTADQVIEFFEAHDGLTEQPANSNCTWISQWFWEQTGKHSALAPGCYAWCAVTVSRALNEAWGNPNVWQVPGISPDWRPGFSYVPSVRAAFERAGRFHATDDGGVKGDLVIFDWDGDGWGDHIGVFLEDLGDGTCHVWEGNTSSNDLSLRRRPYSLIAGFCRPPYDDDQEDDMFDDAARGDLAHLRKVVDELKTELSQAAGTQNWHDVGERLDRKLDAIAAGGGSVDIDALAERVADKLAERLKQ